MSPERSVTYVSERTSDDSTIWKRVVVSAHQISSPMTNPMEKVKHARRTIHKRQSA